MRRIETIWQGEPEFGYGCMYMPSCMRALLRKSTNDEKPQEKALICLQLENWHTHWVLSAGGSTRDAGAQPRNQLCSKWHAAEGLACSGCCAQ